MPSPINSLIDAACMKCVKCSAPMGTCSCWTKCECGWSFETGGACSNPIHAQRAAADLLAADLADEIVGDMADGYKMFQGDRAIPARLRRTIIRRASAVMVEVFKGVHDAKVEHDHKPKR